MLVKLGGDDDRSAPWACRSTDGSPSDTDAESPCDAGTVPIIDNLYLDMNGVIHNCSHGAGTDVNTRMTEDEVRVNHATPVKRDSKSLIVPSIDAQSRAPFFRHGFRRAFRR